MEPEEGQRQQREGPGKEGPTNQGDEHHDRSRGKTGRAWQVIAGWLKDMRRPIIAGNWKMYKTIPEALEFVRVFKPLVVASTHCEIVIAPAFTAIKSVSDRLEGSNVEVAAQDAAAEPGPGAWTGEVSASMIRDAGARWTIIGHSERRQYYGETDDSVNSKIRAVIGAGLAPIVCV